MRFAAQISQDLQSFLAARFLHAGRRRLRAPRNDRNVASAFGQSCLLGRRLVEAGVPDRLFCVIGACQEPPAGFRAFFRAGGIVPRASIAADKLRLGAGTARPNHATIVSPGATP